MTWNQQISRMGKFGKQDVLIKGCWKERAGTWTPSLLPLSSYYWKSGSVNQPLFNSLIPRSLSGHVKRRRRKRWALQQRRQQNYAWNRSDFKGAVALLGLKKNKSKHTDWELVEPRLLAKPARRLNQLLSLPWLTSWAVCLHQTAVFQRQLLTLIHLCDFLRYVSCKMALRFIKILLCSVALQYYNSLECNDSVI